MSETEENKEAQEGVKYLRERYNVKFTSKTLGDLEFQQYSLKEYPKANARLKESLDDRDFAIKLVFDLILKPKLSLEVFRSIPDSELISIIRKICDKNETLKKFFGESVDNRVFTDFKEAIKGYNDEKINDLSREITPIWSSFSETMNTLVSQMNAIQNWARLNSQFFDSAKSSLKYSLTIAEAEEILKKYMWFVSLSLPDSFYGAVLEIEKSGENKEERVNALFIDYFTKEGYKALEELVEIWSDNPYFTPRMEIFRSCLTTLNRAKNGDNPSVVVIPTLLTQIDGIMNEIIADCTLKRDEELKMWVDEYGNQSKRRDDARRKLIASLSEFSPPGRYMLLDVLFQRSYHGEELGIPTTFSRHKIIHGEYIDYGCIENTIKAFLTLDHLSYLGET